MMPTALFTPVLQIVPLKRIVPDPNQPRKHFDEERLGELAASLKEVGLLNPIHLRLEDPRNPEGFYMLISGERRYRSLKNLGVTETPAFIHEGDVLDALTFALVDNLNREGLTPIEQASALNELWQRGVTMEAIGQKIGRSKGMISRTVALLDLPEELQAMVANGRITERFGYALTVQFREKSACQEAFNAFARSVNHHPQEMTVRRLETFLHRRQQLKESEGREDETNIHIDELLIGMQVSGMTFFGRMDELGGLCESAPDKVREAWKNLPSSTRKRFVQALRGIAARSQTVMELLEEEE